MKISQLEFIPVSIPYTHREVSSLIQRDGVTDVLVKAVTDDGLVGWGESCSGANVESVAEALKAMRPFVLGRSPWESEAIRAELWHRGIWSFRKPTASFAYAGIDIALWDICGKACGEPLYNLLGGKVRERVNYFYYLAQGSTSELSKQCRDGLDKGFHVFYLKVGINIEAEVEMVRAVREAIGDKGKIRLDANGAWKVNEAVRNLTRLDAYRIDFIEQPVSQDPVTNMQECGHALPWPSVRMKVYGPLTTRTATSLTAQPMSIVSVPIGLDLCCSSNGSAMLPIARAFKSSSIPTASSASQPRQRTMSC